MFYDFQQQEQNKGLSSTQRHFSSLTLKGSILAGKSNPNTDPATELALKFQVWTSDLCWRICRSGASDHKSVAEASLFSLHFHVTLVKRAKENDNDNIMIPHI